jgi:phospholipase C
MLKRSAVILSLASIVSAGVPVTRLAAVDAGADRVSTRTPIRYVVVIFQENNSFDHYFGTYPNAQNPPGEPAFYAAPATPAVNGLNPTLLEHNPNSTAPFRLDRTEEVTCDNDNH